MKKWVVHFEAHLFVVKEMAVDFPSRLVGAEEDGNYQWVDHKACKLTLKFQMLPGALSGAVYMEYHWATLEIAFCLQLQSACFLLLKHLVSWVKQMASGNNEGVFEGLKTRKICLELAEQGILEKKPCFLPFVKQLYAFRKYRKVEDCETGRLCSKRSWAI